MPRGSWTAHDDRQYEAILASERARGASEKDAERIAAATVNKRRAVEAEAKLAAIARTRRPTAEETAEARRAYAAAARATTNPSKIDLGDRIFEGVFPTGISYADRSREVAGDYARIGFLSFGTLDLTIARGAPAALAAEVRRRAARIQARRGERFEISSTGQAVVLGSNLVRCTWCGTKSVVPAGTKRCPVCREA